MKHISRQRLRRGSLSVSPGGNGFHLLQQTPHQQGDHKLAMNPCPRTRIGPFGQMPEAHDRLHPFQCQLDLPADPVQSSHLLGAEFFRWHRRPDENTVHGGESLSSELPPLAAGGATHAQANQLRRLSASLDGDPATGNTPPVAVHP